MASVGDPPLGIMQTDDFLKDPSKFDPAFEATPGLIHGDPNRITVIIPNEDNGEAWKECRRFKVHTVEELHALRNKLLQCPLVWRVRAKGRKTSHYPGYREVKITRGDFVVKLNTSHPAVANMIIDKFEDAYQCILLDKAFSIEIDITDSIRNWFPNFVDVDPLCCGPAVAVDMGRLYVTNASTYAHCFDCNKYDCAVWPVFWPCWLLTAPFYKLYRHIAVQDIKCDFDDLQCELRVPLNSFTLARVLTVSPNIPESSNQRPPSHDREHPMTSSGAAGHTAPPPSYEEAVHPKPNTC